MVLPFPGQKEDENMNVTHNIILTASLAIFMVASDAAFRAASAQTMSMDSGAGSGMNMMGAVDIATIPRVPPVAGYAEGERVFFLHTEVSDVNIAKIMTDMMASPVPVVPSLAEAPASMLAVVYAFTNGVQPEGPRGPLNFQPDVFDHPVGSEGYSPLRAIHLVTWQDGIAPRLLTSAADVEAAVNASEISIENTGIVVNMPFVTWPGGQR
jgi:hypothetical protein